MWLIAIRLLPDLIQILMLPGEKDVPKGDAPGAGCSGAGEVFPEEMFRDGKNVPGGRKCSGRGKYEAGVMLWGSRLPRGDYAYKCRVRNQRGSLNG